VSCGQEADALRPGQRGGGEVVDARRVDPEHAAEPGDRAAREPPRVLDEVQPGEDAVGLDQPARIGRRARRQRADHLGGAEAAGERAGLRDAGADDVGEIVAGADRDRQPDGQPGERRALGVSTPATSVGSAIAGSSAASTPKVPSSGIDQ
jgi:hypothetical protein